MKHNKGKIPSCQKWLIKLHVSFCVNFKKVTGLMNLDVYAEITRNFSN